jgi:UDP-MurNAc hydroxylase
MKVQFFGNASVVITSASGKKVLCDPWFTQGAFLGSWFTWPPNVSQFREELLETKFDFIYISHLHTDHFDRSFLSKYVRKHPGTPIVIGDFQKKYLKKALLKLDGGGANVVQLKKGKLFSIGDITLKIMRADICNPELCGVQIPCSPPEYLSGIDSIGIFESDGIKILNANDAASLDFAKRVAPIIGKVDLVMGHYAAASPYPQCFPELDHLEIIKKDTITKAIKGLIETAEACGAKFIFPFAGQYALGGRLVKLNEMRAVCEPHEAVQIINNLGSKAEPFSLGIGEEFDLKSEKVGNPYFEVELSEKKRYFDAISGITFPYERVFSEDIKSKLQNNSDEIRLLAQAGVRRILKYAAEDPSLTPHTYHIKAADFDFFINLSNQNPNLSFSSPRFSESVTTLNMPLSLFYHLFREKHKTGGFTNMHWNQADGGSHFIWRRTGSFNAKANYLLNYIGN